MAPYNREERTIVLDAQLTRDGKLQSILGVVRNDDERRLAQREHGCTSRYSKNGIVSFVPDPLIIHNLRQSFDSVVIGRELSEWGATWDSEVHRSAEIQLMSDTDLGSPWDERLRPYQRVGARWIAESEHCILGDDPGTGKTVQALVADKLTNSRRTLILCPAYVIHVWYNHLREWFDEEPIVAYASGRARRAPLFNLDGRYMITNHESLRSYVELQMQTFDHIIVDEAHRFQGRNSNQSRGLKYLTTRAAKITMLTGSPMWNRPNSLWNLLNILYPKRFTSYWRFVDYYCQIEQTPWTQKIVGPKHETLEHLRWTLAPLLFRRKKDDVLPDLPPKTVQIVDYSLSSKQTKQYRMLRDNLRMQTDDGERRYHFSSAGALTDMRRLINMPDVMGVGGANVKLDVIKQLIHDAGLPVVIFVWHKDYANYLGEKLHQAFERPGGTKASVAVLTGETRPEQREVVINCFQNGTFDILVANIAAAGVGINLHRACTAIFAEGTLPGHLNEQAEDRLHRFGQKNTTTIYRLQARRTLEVKLWQASDKYHDDTELTLATQHVIRRHSRS